MRQAKQKEVAAVLAKTPSDVIADGAPGISVHPLADAWNDVNKQMEYRKMLLDQSVAFHSSAIQVISSYSLGDGSTVVACGSTTAVLYVHRRLVTLTFRRRI